MRAHLDSNTYVAICQTGGTQTQDSETGQVNSTREIFIYSSIRPAKPNQANQKSYQEVEDDNVGEVLSCQGRTADWKDESTQKTGTNNQPENLSQWD